MEKLGQFLPEINNSAANAGFAGLKAYDAIKNLQGMANGTGNIASASIGVGFEYSKSKENAESSVPVVTDIRGGNSVSIEAKSGDINSHGAQIIAGYDEYGLISGGAGDISLKAGNDINLESAQATNSSSSSNKSASANVGVSAGVTLSGVGVSVTGNANVGSGKSNSSGTTQVNSHVTGAGDIKLESGRDTNLKGAVVEGETITANVGRDLNIISVPDTGESSNKSSSIGVSGSLGAGGAAITGVSPGYGTGSGKTNWIEEQSGLVAKDKVDVTVGGNTHLGAGKIISESGDLKLDTGTLTHEDFSGSKKYEGFDVQANIDLTGKQQQPDQTSQPNHTAEGSYKKDDTQQEVRATVGPGEIIIRDKDKQAELEASGQTEDLASLNRDPDQAYEITKDKHVEIDFYLSDTSLNAVASGIGKAMEPGGFIDRYLIGRELTSEERSNVREGLDALANGGSFGGCGPQRQGFNRFTPLGWVVSSAYAYETDCFIIKADGSKIELGISTYEQCRDAIKAYLNSLSFDDRTRVIRDSGFVTTSGALPGDLLTWHVNDLVRMVVEDLDGGKRGTYSEFYNQGVFAGQKSGIAQSAEWAAIWNDSALSVSEKINNLYDAGLDVMGIMAAATMGGVGNNSGIAGKGLISSARTAHILYGDRTGGGHLWPGSPGKSPFPKNWTPQRILDEVDAIAKNPNIVGTAQYNRIVKEAVVDNVKIRVVIEPASKGGGVVTAFPTNVPRNP
ncbi:hemagglutinin repeat-containing protein [Pseudochrobactrum lubricantis]|uniref:hemagglutinin repeat-containing protein n=1 Tax=Pseudochrobactrum lubricantis TaxID=558172 RepID=UPI0035DE528F